MQLRIEPMRQPASSPGAGDPGWAVEATGLTRRFGDVTALAGVSLAIRAGEFFSLLGPSGCGKTTLLRLIAGLDLPDAGSLRIGGRDAAGIPAHQRPVNTVFQSYALFPHLSVWDNVAFGLRMKRVPAGQVRERVQRVMELVAISELAGRRPGQLSGGQKQRVALARAVVNEPAVLLLDEPLGALDLKLRKQLQGELHRLQRRLGITFVYVTHDQEEALVMSDRVAVMSHGRIEQLDGAAALYERPRTRFVAQFLGACNLLPGTVETRAGEALSVRTELGSVQVAAREPAGALASGAAVTLAIRPEKVGLAAAGAGSASPGINRVPARVEELIYGGAETQYRLRAGPVTLTAVALNTRAGRQGYEAGASVICELAPEALILLED